MAFYLVCASTSTPQCAAFPLYFAIIATRKRRIDVSNYICGNNKRMIRPRDWDYGVFILGGHEFDDHQPDRRIFLKGSGRGRRKKTSQFHTHDTALPSLFCLFHSYSLVKFLALSHSQAHRHIIACLRWGWKEECELLASKQASKQRLLCSFGPIDRTSMTSLKDFCSNHRMLLRDIFISTRENKTRRLPLFEATKTFLRLCFNRKCPPFCISYWAHCQPRWSYIVSLCVCACVMQLFLSFI